jgi:hypothetical protein
LPGQAGNDNIELAGSVFIDQAEIRQTLGADLGAGYVVVRVKATPKTGDPMRIGPDDFTIISRKDGQRTQALAPNQIAGKGAALAVTGPEGSAGPRRRTTLGLGGFGGGGSSAGANGGVDSKVEPGDTANGPGPLLAVLKDKALADKETTASVEGFLYFPVEGKLKPKDLALVYKGPGGKLVMEFANPKGR